MVNYNQAIPHNKYNDLSWIHPDAVIGEECWIGAFVYISGNVTIGHNVSISNGAQIYDHDNSYSKLSGGMIPKKRYNVRIGSDTIIGTHAVIIPKDSDINIGHNCVIGALSLVKKSIPSYSVAWGVPLHIKNIKPITSHKPQPTSI